MPSPLHSWNSSLCWPDSEWARPKTKLTVSFLSPHPWYHLSPFRTSKKQTLRCIRHSRFPGARIKVREQEQVWGTFRLQCRCRCDSCERREERKDWVGRGSDLRAVHRKSWQHWWSPTSVGMPWARGQAQGVVTLEHRWEKVTIKSVPHQEGMAQFKHPYRVQSLAQSVAGSSQGSTGWVWLPCGSKL